MNGIIKVGMADLKVTCNREIIVTFGLGSCVGIALYDSIRKVAGLAHIMLPSSKITKKNENVAKYADTAIEELMMSMLSYGSQLKNINAKIAGGSQMFSIKNESNNLLRIGERNVASVLEVLQHHRIPVLAQDVGGNFGRTMELHGDTGIVVIKTAGKGTKYI